MQSKPKSNSVLTHELVGGKLVFNVLGAGSVIFDPMICIPEVQDQFLYHGAIQRISDRAAIGRDPETGHSATPAEKLEAICELINHYHAGGAWSMVQSAGPKGGVLFRALCVMYPQRDAHELSEWLKGKSKKEQAALRASDAVRAVIATFETPKTSVDVESLLGEIK